MAPIAPGSVAASASAKKRFFKSAVNWRRLALTTTSGLGTVLPSPGATLRSVSLRSASLRFAPGEGRTEVGAEPFTYLRVPSSGPSVSLRFRDVDGPVIALPCAQGVAQQILNFLPLPQGQ